MHHPERHMCSACRHCMYAVGHSGVPVPVMSRGKRPPYLWQYGALTNALHCLWPAPACANAGHGRRAQRRAPSARAPREPRRSVCTIEVTGASCRCAVSCSTWLRDRRGMRLDGFEGLLLGCVWSVMRWHLLRTRAGVAGAGGETMQAQQHGHSSGPACTAAPPFLAAGQGQAGGRGQKRGVEAVLEAGPKPLSEGAKRASGPRRHAAGECVGKGWCTVPRRPTSAYRCAGNCNKNVFVCPWRCDWVGSPTSAMPAQGRTHA